MKNRFIHFVLFLSELSGRPAPRWLQWLVPKDDLDAMQQAERRLSDRLRTHSADLPQLPPAFTSRLEASLRAEARPAKAAEPLLAWLIPVSAVAVAASFGLFLILQKDESGHPGAAEDPVPITVRTSSADSELPVAAALRIPDLPADLPEQVLVKPLKSEQQRLAADMSNALRFVAQGILPDPYLERINLGLSSRTQQGTTY